MIPRFYHHLSQGPEIQKVDEDLLNSIRGALQHILGSPEDWWYAEACYQTLRNNQWHNIQVLDAKLEDGGASLASEELDLAAEVVECAEHLRLRSDERKESSVSGIAALAGLAATVIGIIAILG